MTRHVIVAVGNAYRGDDGVALAIAEELAAHVPDGVEVVSCEQEPTRMLDAWEGATTAIVVDAIATGGEAGTLHRYDATDEALPARVFRSSTHAFGIGDAIELARVMHRLPRRVIVYGIEGQTFESGHELSAPVGAAVERAAEAILDDVHRLVELEATCTSGH